MAHFKNKPKVPVETEDISAQKIEKKEKIEHEMLRLFFLRRVKARIFTFMPNRLSTIKKEITFCFLEKLKLNLKIWSLNLLLSITVAKKKFLKARKELTLHPLVSLVLLSSSFIQ